MLIVMAIIYFVACVTRDRITTVAVGVLFTAALNPSAVAAAFLICIVALLAPATIAALRIYTIAALALILAKNSLASEHAELLAGVSFVLFQGFFTLRDKQPTRSAGTFLIRGTAQLIFYPQLLCGPILRPKAYAEQSKRHSRFRHQYAHALFASGLFLKIWCADVLAVITTQPDETGIFHGLLLLAQTYSDFAGWCLLAAAIGLASGIKIPRNFRFPLRSKSVAIFWTRWNTTLNAWIREAIPLRKVSSRTTSWLGVLVYCAVLALWHGLRFNFVAFALVNMGFFLLQMRLRSRSLQYASQFAFYLCIGFFFFNHLPTTWLAIDVSQLDRIVVAASVLAAYESGITFRTISYRRFWINNPWLLPIFITLLMVFRPASNGFIYANF